MKISNLSRHVGLSFLSLTASATVLYAQSASFAPSVNIFGTTGLIDLPTAESQKDAELSATISKFGGFTRGSFTFQVLPRVSGTFRYAKLDNWNANGEETYDRSFDIRYRVVDEDKYVPALAIGLRDFMGTGIYSSQYIVATKAVHPKLKVTAGLGWGRLSGDKTTSLIDFGQGGKPKVEEWFRGSVAPFGGLEWQTPVDGLRLKAEYSPDEYARENSGVMAFERKSSANFGLDYQFKNGMELGAYYLYGSEVGLKFTTSVNPYRGVGVADKAPVPVRHRSRAQIGNVAWVDDTGFEKTTRAKLDKALNKDGIAVEVLSYSASHAEVRFRNNRYGAAPQAIGRVARAMANQFPASVSSFTIIPMEKGLATSAITLKRDDLEQYENHPNGAALMSSVVDVTDAPPLPKGAQYSDTLYPDFSWSLSPYATLKIFDSQDPFALNAGLRLRGGIQVARGLTFSGSITKRLVESLSEPDPSPSGLAPVRTDAQRYTNAGDPALEHLTAEYMFKLAPSVYSRITAGYLETMYGGISGEVLWKPAEKKWGLGAEVNYVKQRDFDQRLDFRDYSIATGHVSGYYELPKGFEAQVDVGRYLAGDVGATVAVDRTFNNGWRVGAYATITDASAEDFGEGSFDKGIRITIPMGWALGKPSRKTVNNTLASITRDGGARVNVNNRLIGVVRDTHMSSISGSWGRFWK